MNSTLKDLKCAASCLDSYCQQPLTVLAFLLASLLGSLSNNELCGIDRGGEGTYNAEGIIALAEALKQNGSLQSLKCVAPLPEDPTWTVSSR